MPTGFQQQQPVRNNGFCKPSPTPQHGGPAAPKAATPAPQEPFSFPLRPRR